MAQMDEDFDSSQAPDRQKFDLIPLKTKAPMLISDSDLKPTSAGDGKYIKFTIDIIDGPYKGRKIFQNINYINPNETAQNIGRAELKEICQAVGKLTIKDTQEVHGIPFIGTIGIEKDKTGQYSDKNKVIKFENPSAPATGAAAPAQPAAQGATPTPATPPKPAAPTGRPGPATAAPPWKK